MGENFQSNLELVDVIQQIARRKDVTAAQLALAWVMAQGDDIVPIPGTRRRKRLEENVGAVQIQLSPDEMQEIATALPSAAGERYGEIGMRELRR